MTHIFRQSLQEDKNDHLPLLSNAWLNVLKEISVKTWQRGGEKQDNNDVLTELSLSCKKRSDI